ncbi:MAG: hypothetical protein M1826_007059 [Phylliscum demangeonii]|nr:MAG: hypothetical protein M1826_007059 [Phylliscum demangeonii]
MKRQAFKGDEWWSRGREVGGVTCYDEDHVVKIGQRVRPCEEAAQRLVKQHTNVPDVYFSNYIPPATWQGHDRDDLDEATSERICRQIWALVAAWRAIPPPPPELCHLAPCLAIGSAATWDPLLQDLNTRTTMCALRGHALPDMLPPSPRSLFTHRDVAPRNSLVDGRTLEEITGWYPDYWEDAIVWKTSVDGDWQRRWRERSAPRRWDLSGIKAASRVRF